MEDIWRRVTLNFVGILFIIFGVAGVINAIYYGNYIQIFWFCYIGLIIMGLGVLYRNSFLIGSQVNILGIPLIIWSVDFIYLIITKKTFLGVTNYILLEGPIIPKIISMQHLISVPLALIAIFLIGLGKRDMWKFSFVELSLVFFVSLLLGSVDKNINCVYAPCFNIELPGFYPFIWFFVMFLFVMMVNFLVVFSFYKKKVNK